MKLLARSVSTAGAAMLAALVAVSPLRSQTIVAGSTTASLQAGVGDRISVPVAIDMSGAPAFTLGAYRAAISWNNTQLSLVGTSSGAFGAAVFNTGPAADSGVARFSAVNPAGAVGVKVLATFTFEVLAGDVGSSIGLTFQELTAATGFQNLLPFLTTTSGLFCAILQYGDLDGNGQVQSLDAQIALMHSVGLGVPQGVLVSRGDVDNNGQVDPRDALIILSSVIALDVGQFRVKQPVSGACVPGAAASVSVQPGPVTIAAGDTFRLSAEVRDAGGQLLGGKNLGWASSATGVATVDANGKVTAVGAGTATITAAVAPGLTGTATVTVGPRHRWVVNPGTAQGPAGQVGSDLLPFGTIAQAIAAAAVDDTVAIAIASYHEPISTTKRLVFLGDSTAAGMPTISVPGGAAGVIEVTGLQVIRRLRFNESLAGLAIRAGEVDLSALGMTALRGPALMVRGAARANLRDINISGVSGAGIFVDSADVVDIFRSRVAGVIRGLVPLLSMPEEDIYTMAIFARADTVRVNQATVQGILGYGIVTMNSQLTSVQASTVTQVGGEEDQDPVAIGADSAVTLEVGGGTVIREGGGIVAAADTVRISNTTIQDVPGDAIGIDPRPLSGGPYHLLSVDNVTVIHASGGVRGTLGGRAVISNSTFTDLQDNALAPDADTIVVASVVVQNGQGSGLRLTANDVVTVTNSRFLFLRQGGVRGDSGVRYFSMTGSRVTGVMDFDAYGVYVAADSVLLENDTLENVQFGPGLFAQGGEWLKVRTSLVRRTGSAGIMAGDFSAVEIYGTTVDSTVLYSPAVCEECGAPLASPAFSFDYGVALLGVGSVLVDSSSIRHAMGVGLTINATGSVTINRNLIADHQDQGLQIDGAGTAQGTLNSFRRNGYFGLSISAAGGGTFPANNFEGNGYGAASIYGTLDVTSSWWGDVNGPRCLSGAPGCSGSGVGDYAFGANVTVTGYRTDGPVPGAPAGAPPLASKPAASHRPAPGGAQ